MGRCEAWGHQKGLLAPGCSYPQQLAVLLLMVTQSRGHKGVAALLAVWKHLQQRALYDEGSVRQCLPAVPLMLLGPAKQGS